MKNQKPLLSNAIVSEGAALRAPGDRRALPRGCTIPITGMLVQESKGSQGNVLQPVNQDRRE